MRNFIFITSAGKRFVDCCLDYSDALQKLGLKHSEVIEYHVSVKPHYGSKNDDQIVTKFTEGQEIFARSVCDQGAKFKGKIIRRTDKSVWATVEGEGVKRYKIHLYENEEFILPLGDYSMAPRFKAGNK